GRTCRKDVAKGGAPGRLPADRLRAYPPSRRPADTDLRHRVEPWRGTTEPGRLLPRLANVGAGTAQPRRPRTPVESLGLDAGPIREESDRTTSRRRWHRGSAESRPSLLAGVP